MDLLDKDGDAIRFLIDPHGRLREPLGSKDAWSLIREVASTPKQSAYPNKQLPPRHVSDVNNAIKRKKMNTNLKSIDIKRDLSKNQLTFLGWNNRCLIEIN